MTAETETVAAPEDDTARERERSTISFPYGDLDSAIAVAKGIHEVGGSACETEQLAGHWDVKHDTGAFRLKLLTAKIFGLTTYAQGTVRLTALGARICDATQERRARADAFLTVPLYAQLYERYKGNALPPTTTALEAELASLGVAKKQTDKARQALQRSAQQAGFLWAGPDRLVMPKGLGAAAPGVETETKRNDQHDNPLDERQRNGGGGGAGSGSGGGERHPFIAGLLKELPAEGQDWATEDRGKWLQAAAMIFDLIYKNPNGGKTLKIEVSAK